MDPIFMCPMPQLLMACCDSARRTKARSLLGRLARHWAIGWRPGGGKSLTFGSRSAAVPQCT